MSTGETLLESIRKRPAMYVGGTDEIGLHHLLFWVIDDLVANARAGRGSAILVSIDSEGSCYVVDEGPFPDQESLLENLDRMTSECPDAVVERGIIPENQVRSYLPIVRALSACMAVAGNYPDYDGACWKAVMYTQETTTGRRDPLEGFAFDFGELWNCGLRFWPDPEIFGPATWNPDIIRRRLQEASAACPDLRVYFGKEELTVRDGMSSIVRRTLQQAGERGFLPEEPARLQVSQGDLTFDVAIQWHWANTLGEQTIQSWANTVRTTEGTHVLAVKEALRAANLDDVPYVAAVSVFVPHPRFVSPTKGCLQNPEIRVLIRDHLTTFLRRLVEQDKFAFDLDWIRVRRPQLAQEKEDG